MPSIKPAASLGANGTANLLAGSQYEFLPFPARLDFAVFCAAGGAVDATIYSGSDVLLEASPLDEKAVTDPITVFDFQVSDVAGAGERISLSVRETAGAAGPTAVRALVRITPI